MKNTKMGKKKHVYGLLVGSKQWSFRKTTQLRQENNKKKCLDLRWGTGKSSYSLWWLISYVNLSGPWDAQMFLSESETMTLEKLNTWIGDRNKAANPLQLGEHHLPGYGSKQISRVEEGPVLLCWVLDLRAWSSVLMLTLTPIDALAPCVFTLELVESDLLASPSLQHEDGRSQDFLASTIKWVNTLK